MIISKTPISSFFTPFSTFFFFFFFLLQVQRSLAQNATTDLSEVSALNLIFQQWDTQATPLWNISGDPCNGSAINETEFETSGNNPAIKCDCSFNNNKTCHIIKLRVHKLGKRGMIPEEVTALKYLAVFKIDENYFTGPLPAFIGNLSALVILSVSHNSFYGALPKELGNLKDLFMLSIGSNNFSGTLPPELGNLINLKQIYLDSSGVGGEIPSTFANLRNMVVMWATDSPFSGKIPDFIGNWTRLTSLRFQGSSIVGPIPYSFSQLTMLESLRISDIYNGSSSLDFIINLKNLSELILRNALFTGTIPSDIGKLKHLKQLDLSFNNLTGEIPSLLFNMNNLTHLFLGNNSLSGALSIQWSDTLMHIDLSYNYLSGRLPPWVTSISQLVIPGLDCLQRNFPCNRDIPLYNDFSIKCGGPKVIGRTGLVYESENLALGPAKFYVNDERWAVSKVGLFADKTGKLDLEGTKAQVTGSNENPELFRTARMSPGSLRYYGLGLENGPYTVTLHFAEIGFPNRNSQTWAGLARRVFDIYIQGTLKKKDFDIANEAGGVERAIVKTYNVTVSENYLEIHLFWAGKGTCCIPEEGYYGPLIAAVHAASDGGRRSTQGENRTGLIAGIAVSATVVVFILLFSIPYMRRKSRDDDDEELLGTGPRPVTFSYAELRAATNDFSSSNKLGEGGFGEVHKGTLSDGRVVAVKQIAVASTYVKRQFVSEIATISVVQHRNLVKLNGCCIEGNRRILVYEYLENKSLDQLLFGKVDLHLDWRTRFNICLGTARGLAYLHEESMPRIIHRDVKASNILLDDTFCPKISDFGLAKLYDENKTHISTRVAGTIGYLAPEYALRGRLTEKADVFGFGVVALEIVSGKPNIYNTPDGEIIYLLETAWTLHENNQSLGLVDPRLVEFNEIEVIRVVQVALLCTQASATLRPSMSRVVGMLAGDVEIDTDISKPSYLTELGYKNMRNLNQGDAMIPLGPMNDPMFPSPYSLAAPISDVITEGR
ncbi:probable LRR receptor-like serine/threonine-protein kinase At1g56140 isoform X2 [Humulus lupulus]|uniref:probable LRR receptor-like serine/threonine-protein kinase At1g56140 isoform X2 n=1 Tax=Humulus lupulus TaxID=3486 RepID=UPI002B40F377|nr:probable LRR receptor-like serine/threonine-protein kinase At1g56140 isoform X2 [Humulus lupulus]